MGMHVVIFGTMVHPLGYSGVVEAKKTQLKEARFVLANAPDLARRRARRLLRLP